MRKLLTLLTVLTLAACVAAQDTNLVTINVPVTMTVGQSNSLVSVLTGQARFLALDMIRSQLAARAADTNDPPIVPLPPVFLYRVLTNAPQARMFASTNGLTPRLFLGDRATASFPWWGVDVQRAVDGRRSALEASLSEMDQDALAVLRNKP